MRVGLAAIVGGIVSRGVGVLVAAGGRVVGVNVGGAPKAISGHPAKEAAANTHRAVHTRLPDCTKRPLEER